MERLVADPCQIFREKWQGWGWFLGKEKGQGVTPVKRKSRNRSKDEWVALAWDVAGANGGALPSPKRLVKENSSLVSKISDNPEWFSDVPQERCNHKIRTIDQWVDYAKDVARKNRGRLPTSTYLRKHHASLCTMLGLHKEAFVGIPREFGRSRSRSLDEWVEFASDLARENDGVLPEASVLAQRHPGLAAAKYRNPEAFSGIPQLVRSTQGDLLGVRINGKIKSKGATV